MRILHVVNSKMALPRFDRKLNFPLEFARPTFPSTPTFGGTLLFPSQSSSSPLYLYLSTDGPHRLREGAKERPISLLCGERGPKLVEYEGGRADLDLAVLNQVLPQIAPHGRTP